MIVLAFCSDRAGGALFQKNTRSRNERRLETIGQNEYNVRDNVHNMPCKYFFKEFEYKWTFQSGPTFLDQHA